MTDRRHLSKDGMDAIKAVVLYILRNGDAEKRDVYGVVKTAYFAQRSHLARYASPLFDDAIVALAFGPVPSAIYDLLKVARGDAAVKNFYDKDSYALLMDAANSVGFDSETFNAKDAPDMGWLSKSDVECLDEAVRTVAGMSFDAIVKDTHGAEWDRARHSADRVMDPSAIAIEEGADAGTTGYIREGWP